MIRILFLAADPTSAARLRLGEEVREIREKLQLSKFRDEFVPYERMSIRPTDISQALLDTSPQIVHFSGHGTSTGELCIENLLGQIHPIQAETLAALFKIFASEVDCVLLNACYSIIQAEAIAEHIQYVIGMNQAIGDKAAIAFSVGFYQALGAGRTIEEAYNLGCIQIRLQNIPEHLTPVLVQRKISPSTSPQADREADWPPSPVASRSGRSWEVIEPFNLSFEESDEGNHPLGWFDSLGFVDYVSTRYEIETVRRPSGGTGKCVLFRNKEAEPHEFGSLMQRCPAEHLAGHTIRLEGEVRTLGVEKWAGLWLRADGRKEFNLFFDNMSSNPIRGSTPWRLYFIQAHLPARTTWLNYGIVLDGSGTMWADNFRLLVWHGGRWVDHNLWLTQRGA